MLDLMRESAGSREALDGALEAMHFAFRAVVRGPDAELAKRGLSRVHHRILYFIAKTPGQSVSALVRTLGVTKQAIHASLQELRERGLVDFMVDERDRRSKRLRLTARGRQLEQRLSGEQRKLFAGAFEKAGRAKTEGWHEVMKYLVTEASKVERV